MKPTEADQNRAVDKKASEPRGPLMSYDDTHRGPSRVVDTTPRGRLRMQRPIRHKEDLSNSE